MDKEGDQIARWLNSLGVTAFVLKYRLGPKYHHPVELGDAQRAIRTVRFKAPEYRAAAGPYRHHGVLGGRTPGVDGGYALRCRESGSQRPHRPGEQPSGLSWCCATRWFRSPASCTRGRSAICWGTIPIAKLVESLSNEMQVTAQTPPTFLFHTNADTGVPAENSMMFFHGAAQGGRAGGNPHLRKGSSRRGPGADGRGSFQLAREAGGLDARARVTQFGSPVSSCDKLHISSYYFGQFPQRVAADSPLLLVIARGF